MTRLQRLALIRQRSIRHFSLAKLIANTLFLLFTEVLMLPVFAVLYNVPVLPRTLINLRYWSFSQAAWEFPLLAPRFPPFPAQARMRELLLPLLLLPLLTPVLVASTCK